MATNIKGGTSNKLALQPGAVIFEQQDGSLTGRATWKGAASLLNTRIQKGDLHPKGSALKCFQLQTTWLKLEQIQVEADFIGIPEGATATPYFLEPVGSIGEEPIETHPNFVSVIGGTPSSPLHGAKFDSDTGEFLGFPANATNHLGGVRSYYRPSVIVRSSYWTTDAPNLGPLGQIIDPSTVPGLILPDQCHDLLVTNLGSRKVAAVYQVTVEALASGPLGWNDLIYLPLGATA